MQDLQYLIWLTATAAIPPQKAWALLSAFGGARAVYEAPAEALARAVPLTPAERLRLRLHTLAPAQTVLERCRRGGIRLLPIFDPDYPERLKNIYDPPVLLYVRGTLPPLGRMAAITVVGTRRCTPYGALTAERFGYQLSAAGAAVISGMAEGVDSAAHRGALRGPTPTVAVFGTAIDGCYPASNGGLLRDILRAGAAVSEYPPGSKTPKGAFPRRNRILAGLSLGVLVVEAPARSGALITAGLALDQGRDVFAVPGGIDAPASAGANELIQNGARLVRGVADILREYQGVYDFSPPAAAEAAEPAAAVAAAYAPRPRPAAPAPAASPVPPAPEPHPASAAAPAPAAPLLAALADGPLPFDALLARAGMTATEALALLTVLELRGLIRQLPGRVFERVPRA